MKQRRPTRLDCSSWSVSSSTAWVCFCLISWIWASWVLFSSSMALFSSVTSCSRLALDGWIHTVFVILNKYAITFIKLSCICLCQYCMTDLSSCCVAVVSNVSSSSDLRASNSSPRSRLIFSALFLAARSDSRSSWRSEMCPSSSLIFFKALFFWAVSSSNLGGSRVYKVLAHAGLAKVDASDSYASVTGLTEMFTVLVTPQDFTWPKRFVTPPLSLRAGPWGQQSGPAGRLSALVGHWTLPPACA